MQLRNYILTITLILIVKISFGQCGTIVNNIPGAMVVNPGQTVCVAAGNYNGNITVQPGGTLRICGSVTLAGTWTMMGTLIRPASTTISGVVNFVTGTVTVDNNACGPSCSAPNTGSIGNPQTICEGGNPSTLTNGGTGGASTYQWQWSPNGSNSWTTIGGATLSTYNPPAGLTVDRWYRRRGGDCLPTQWSSSWTNTVKVTVIATPSAGTIGNPHTICEGGNPSTLTNGGTGGASTFQWQWSPNGSNSWTTISGATSSTYNPPAGLTVDRWYKRRGRASCSPNTWSSWSNTVKVTVVATPSAGTIGNPHTICEGGNPSTLTNGGTGGASTYQWQWSPNGSNSWTTISGATSSTYNPPAGLTVDRWYKRRGRANCSPNTWSSWSNTVEVTVVATPSAGTIGNPHTICSGGDPSTITNIAGGGASIFEWQWSPNGSNSWTTISGATSSTYNPPSGLTVDRWYKRRGRASCSPNTWSSWSNTIQISIASSLNEGSIGSAQTICYNTSPTGLTNDISPTGGTGSYAYQWQSSPDNATWSNIAGATSATHSPGALTTDTYYRRRVISCETKFSNSVLITVRVNLVAGAVSSAQTICYNTAPSGLTDDTAPTGGTGSYTYQWQSSTDDATWSNISGATSVTYSPSNLTTSTYFRREVTSGACGTVYTSSVLVTVYDDLVVGAIGSAQTICYNTAPSGLTDDTAPTGGTGSYTYQWQSSTDDATWSNISGATSVTYSPSNLTTSTYYRREVTSGACGTVYTSSVLVTVYDDLVAGAIGSAQTICYNTVPSGLTDDTSPTGGTGSYTYQWQSSTDDATWSNISGATSVTYSPSNLTTSTYYRREVTSGACGTVYTSSVLVTVYDDLVAGAIGSAQTICYNTVPSGLTDDTSPTGGTGSYTYQWQSSTDDATWSNISGATSVTYSPSNLTTSTYFRREVTSGACGTVYTSSVLVTVYDDLVAGAIGSAQTICYNTAPSGLTDDTAPTGGTGSYTYQWQSSTDDATWSNISGATSVTYSPSNLTTSTYYRREVTSGACGTVYTSSVLVTVYDDLVAGAIGSAQTICYNTVPSGLTDDTSPTGGTGSYTYQWQSSTDDATWSNISGATSVTYSPSNLTTSTYYRREVTSGACGTVYTSSVLVTVYDDLVAGAIGSAQTICYNTVPSGLTDDTSPTGGTGSYTYQWQSSTDDATWSNISGATSVTYSPSNLTTSTYFRREVTSGACGTVYTSSVLVTVYDDLVAGAIGSAQTICYNTAPSGLTDDTAPTGGTGSYTYQWQSSTDDATWSNISGATSATYSPGNLTTSTYFRREVTSGACGTVYTSSVLVTVYDDLVAGSIGSAQTICYNTVPSGLTDDTSPTGGTGSYTYQWQSSTDDATWSNISGATSATYSPGNLTTSTYFRREVTSGACGTVYTSSVLVAVYDDLVAGAIGSAQTICYNTVPSGLTDDTAPTGGTGSYTYQWQSSTDDATWSNISGAISVTYSPSNLTTSTYFRREVTSGACGTVYTSSVLVTVYDDLVAGAIGSAQTICYNTVPSGLTDDTSPTGGTGSYTYQWQSSTDDATWSNISGATSVTYSPSNLTTSTYFRREVTSWLCESKHTSSILITVHPDLIPGTIGSNHTICYNEDPNLLTSDFDASGGDGTYTYQWHWSDDNLTGWNNISGATNSTYDPPAGLTEERFYRRKVTSCGQTKYSEIITVSINELPVVNIGNDTIICRENDYVLNSNAPFAVIFEWNDLSTLSTLNTSGQGEYSVIVIDANGCTNYDTIQVDTFVSPVPTLNIQDTAICFGESVTLEVDPIYNFYAWTNSGSFTNSTIVDETNEYILRIFDANGCFGSDTADVLVNNLPNSKIGDSIKFCLFKDLILTVPEQDAQYSWSTSGINRTEQIFGPGKYWVDVIDTNKCFNSDSVIVFEGEKIPVDLGNDTTICLGTTLTLDASFINTEIWQDIDTLSKYDVSVAGTYNVLVINDEGCYGRDTIEISVSDIPVIEIINGDSLPICELAFQEKTLSIIDNEGMNILWSNYDESDSIIVTNADFYTVSKANQFYCTGYDTIEVYEYCRPVALTMPNIFTPNGDGINESFIPIEVPSEPLDYYMSHIKSIKFEIYNRWGRVLYSSSGILPNWDGINLNIGEPCASGTYYWTLIYSDVSGENYSKNGFVQIVR